MVLPIGPSGYFNLDQFVKTELTKLVQKTVVDNHIAQNGVASLSSSVSKAALGAKSKKPDGIAMGEQLNGDFIPIIYGYLGMTNKQFDEGQKPSEVDTSKTTQQVRIAVSEGPVAGLVFPTDANYNYTRIAPNSGYQNDVLKCVVVDEKYVIDPITGVANFKDIKFRMSDAGLNYIYNGKIEKTNPLVTDPTDPDPITITNAANDTVVQRRLNDLVDVNASRGENYVLYWNSANTAWESKAFNTLLNTAGLNYQGGAGGSGGDGGSGGSGGKGGAGGVGAIDTSGSGTSGIRYTQWNPPPAHVISTGESETTTTVTPYSSSGGGGGGALLKKESAPSPFFSTTVTDIDDNVSGVTLTFSMPNGMYKEIVTTTTAKSGGQIIKCGTERPIANSGDLNCLTPDITVSQDGQTATTKTRVGASASVRIAMVTNVCGRTFILHEDTIGVSGLHNGHYETSHTFSLSSMNAGAGSLPDGTQQIGPLDGSADPDCDPAKPNSFDYQNYTLQDYLTLYPNQIVRAIDSITVYAWLEDTDEEEVSTPVYLKSVTVTDGMDVHESGYSQGSTGSNAYSQTAPDHGIAAFAGNTSNANGYSVGEGRSTTTGVSGSYSSTHQPDPLQVLAGTYSGQDGEDGAQGVQGVTGTTGQAGQSGTASAPAADPIPDINSSNSIYSGNGTIGTFTLSAITVIHSDPLENITVVLQVPSTFGNLDVTSVNGSISVSGRGTPTLTFIGKVADIQSSLNSGVKFTSSTSATGDVTITMTASGSGGNTTESYLIRSQTQVEPVAPKFQIIVQNYVGTFDAYVRGKAIMNSITGATSNEATAQAIASAITSYTSIPNWTASAASNIVTVTGPVALGSSYNGVQPTFTGTMGAQISQIGGGISPTRITQPSQNTSNLVKPQNFVKFGSYSNALNDPAVAWAEVVYRPEQDSGTTSLSDIGIVVAGRRDIQEPINDTFIPFDVWKDTYNFNHPPSAISESAEDGITFSQNAAGHFRDYLVNTRYGMGNDIDWNSFGYEAWVNINRDIYDAMAWCEDYKIKTNGIIFGQESKIEALQNIAATFAGRFVYINGYPRLIFEGQNYDHDYTHTNRTTGAQSQYTRKRNLKKLVNQSSAGNTVYTGNSIENLFNKINVEYNDPKNHFKLTPATVEISKNSVAYPFSIDRETSIDFWGVGDSRLAHFLGMWFFETERSNSETLSYVAGWDHYDVFPGDLIMFNDTLRMDKQHIGGRVVSDNGDGTLTLDRDCGSGLIYVTDSHGNICEGNASGTIAFVQPGTGLVYNPELQVDEEVEGYFIGGAVWNMDENDDNLYRVIAIEESQDGIYAVTAQKHDANKYTRIRQYADQF